MKQFRNAILLLLVLLLCTAGCQAAPDAPDVTDPPEVTSEVTRQEELEALYDAAVEAVTGDVMALELWYEKTVTVGGQTYGESGEVTMDYWNMGGDDFLASVEQSVSFAGDAYEFDMKEIYSGGTVYQTLPDGKFTAELTAEEFLSRYTPVRMLDAALYTLSADDGEREICFEDGTAGESWLIPGDAQVISASGRARLNDAGSLTGSDYTVEYRYGAASVTVSCGLSIENEGRRPTVPEDGTEYVPLENIDSVSALDYAYGYLNQARHVTTSYNSTTMSAAAVCTLQNTSNVDVYAVGDRYAMRWVESVAFTDYSTGESSGYEQEETFIDGEYSVSVDGGQAETSGDVAQSDVEGAVTSMLGEWILSNEYIASGKSTELGSAILYEYECTEEFAEILRYNVCYNLFADGTLLDGLASAYETNTMDYYLAVDKYTGLPTAVGSLYEGVHVIDGVEYLLSVQDDQSFDLASMSAYETVFEAPAPEEEPEASATPLFYHVTGAEGQEMWLLGTIHAGDERTGFLPEEIYDAFRGSSALAIECDNDAFSEQLETDAALLLQASRCYVYADGSMTADHIETPELHDTALQALKAAGQFNYNAKYMKPFFWSSAIDDFTLRLGYGLTYEKGVENRLTALAEETGIPVWEVESNLFQLQMFSDFSDHLQEVLLYNSLAFDAVEYRDELTELYELWCAGDEAALTEILKDEDWHLDEEDIDLDGLTGEELERAQAVLADLDNINAQIAKLQQEYDKAVIVERNEGMLEVAKGYLESGDTVFYAVGLAHLLAENGLVNTLRDAGYTVEPVAYQ